jgi:hypothetical protein
MARPRSVVDPQDWATALALLEAALSDGDEVFSTTAFRKELERKGIEDPKLIIRRLRFYDDDAEMDPGCKRPKFEFYHHGRSFYSEQAYNELEDETDEEAKTAYDAEAEEAPEDGVEAVAARRSYRQEEARVVPYVRTALDEMYASDFGPEDIEAVAFDVHNRRAGSEYENVDVLAVHWRSEKRVDIVTVEIKLHFGPQVVHQAHNYTRFSNRVWIAVPVTVGSDEAAVQLREENPTLFDYVTEVGLGILGCHRRQGGKYDVFPLHWPRRFEPDPVEFDGFVERYRPEFEDTRVVEPERRRHYAKIR